METRRHPSNKYTLCFVVFVLFYFCSESECISSKHRTCDSIHVFTLSSYFPILIIEFVASRYDIILLQLDSTRQFSNGSRDALLLVLVVVLSTQTQIGYTHTTEHYVVSLHFRLSFMYFFILLLTAHLSSALNRVCNRTFNSIATINLFWW